MKVKKQGFSFFENFRKLKKNAQNQRAKLIFWKWVKLLLYNFGLFQQVFENLKLNKLVKEEQRLDLEDRIWRLKFGKTQFWSCILKNEFESLYFWKAIFHFFGVWQKRSSLENFTFGSGIYIRRKRRRWAYSFIKIGTLQALGSNQNPRFLEEDDAFFFTMRSKDSETAHLHGSGPVLRHNNACVRDVLTAPSKVFINLGLNLFHSYF